MAPKWSRILHDAHDAANAPTPLGAIQKRQVCLLRFPLAPCTKLDGSIDLDNGACFTPTESEKEQVP